MTDGTITWTDIIDDRTWAWESPAALAQVFWKEYALPTADERDGPATGCVYDLVDVEDERAPTIVDAVMVLAPNEAARTEVRASLETIGKTDVSS